MCGISFTGKLPKFQNVVEHVLANKIVVQRKAKHIEMLVSSFQETRSIAAQPIPQLKQRNFEQNIKRNVVIFSIKPSQL